MTSPFWLLIFGLLVTWFITSGRANALLKALTNSPNAQAQAQSETAY